MLDCVFLIKSNVKSSYLTDYALALNFNEFTNL